VCAGIWGMKIRNLFLALIGGALAALGYIMIRKIFGPLNGMLRGVIECNVVVLTTVIFYRFFKQNNEGKNIENIITLKIIFKSLIKLTIAIISMNIFHKILEEIFG
jgi:hypothetical protein